MANKILRYVRRVKAGVVYRKLTAPLKVVTVADSAYKANDDLSNCIALRGYVMLIVGTDKNGKSKFPGGPCVVVEWVSKKFDVVTRSSFGAELRNQVEAAQSSVFLSSFFEETSCQLIQP